MRRHLLFIGLCCFVCASGCLGSGQGCPEGIGLTPDLEAALAKVDLREGVRIVRERKTYGDDLYEALEAKARSDDWKAALFGVTLLGRIPNRGQGSVLEDVASRSSDKALRCHAMYSMGLLRDPAAVPFLLKVLDSATEREYDRWTAACAVVIIRDGIVDEMPVEVWWYVLVPDPSNTLGLPTLDSRRAELPAWWEANSQRLLADRRVADYRRERLKAK